jgi:hypothetical protein
MMLDLTPDLVRRLKRQRTGGLLSTLPDRVTHARQGKLIHVEFLELLLQDEIDRRDGNGLTLRLEQAAFEEAATLEQIVWDSPVSFDRARVRELFSLHWLASRRTSSSAVSSAWGSSSPAPSGTVPVASPSPSSCRRSISPGPITSFERELRS